MPQPGWETSVMGAFLNGEFLEIVRTISTFLERVNKATDVTSIRMVWGRPRHSSRNQWIKIWDNHPLYRSLDVARAASLDEGFEFEQAGQHFDFGHHGLVWSLHWNFIELKLVLGVALYPNDLQLS